jgi:DNA-binding winged helix-turn-helix (wHTH) protein
MTDSGQIWFGQFCLDVQGELLWHTHERLSLSPKAFAILRYLVEHQGQLVTKASLLETIWPDTVVGDGVLAVGIAELRKALGDDPHAPRFIETVHRRGYRFITAVAADATPLVHSSRSTIPSPSPPSSQPKTLRRKSETVLVGRDAELLQLHKLFDTAAHGERYVVFVPGEAGSGKTALVESFLHSLASRVRRPASDAYGEAPCAQTRDPSLRTRDAAVWHCQLVG